MGTKLTVAYARAETPTTKPTVAVCLHPPTTPHARALPPVPVPASDAGSTADTASAFSSASPAPVHAAAATKAPAQAIRQSAYSWMEPPQPSTKDPRIVEAEKILDAIAQEYAAKRAAGTVPSKPVHPRTLLWEEMARNRSQVGRRGQCVFGRDNGRICGCTAYKKIRDQANTGGVCECCHHGAPWHKLSGAYAMRSSRFSRSLFSSAGTNTNNTNTGRGSRFDSAMSSDLRSSAFDSELYDSEEEDLDDEAIANEIAMPGGMQMPMPMQVPTGMYDDNLNGVDMSAVDRPSLMSNTSSFGYPSRLSSGVNTLQTLLSAIAMYREMGMSEDEIEERIQHEFPPVPRKSTGSFLSNNQHDM